MQRSIRFISPLAMVGAFGALLVAGSAAAYIGGALARSETASPTRDLERQKVDVGSPSGRSRQARPVDAHSD